MAGVAAKATATAKAANAWDLNIVTLVVLLALDPRPDRLYTGTVRDAVQREIFLNDSVREDFGSRRLNVPAVLPLPIRRRCAYGMARRLRSRITASAAASPGRSAVARRRRLCCLLL